MTTYIGGGAVTHTKRNSTLFAVLPASYSVPAAEQAALFSSVPDFLAARRVARDTSTLLFLDFSSEAAATFAMRLLSGKLPCEGMEGGLKLDFDRDVQAKRAAALERAAKKEEALFCVVCHAPCLWLAPLSRLEALPRRATDGAAAVDEAALLRQCSAAEGPPVLIQRPGRGVERQVPLSCRKCGVRWGYRSAPLGQPSKCTYVHENGLTHSLRGGEAAAALREEARAALGGGGGGKRGRPAESAAGGSGGAAAGAGGAFAPGGAAGTAPEAGADAAAPVEGGGSGDGGGGEEEEAAEGQGFGALAGAPTTFSCPQLVERYEKALKRIKGAP
jgi:hypothetical protein